MTKGELEQKRQTIEANVLAMGICLAQQRHLLYLVEGCIANPSRDNLDILEGEERVHRDWLVRMAFDKLPCHPVPDPAPARTAKEEP